MREPTAPDPPSPGPDAESAEGEETPSRLRVPTAAAAIGVLALLLVLLGVGLYANARLRGPTTVLAPASQPTPQAAAPTSAPAPTALPTPPPLPSPTPAAIPTAPPTPRPAAAPTNPPTPAQPASATPKATEPPTPLPTVEPTLAAEVGAAYENFWRVTSQALLQLDTNHLSDVMADDYLAAVTNRISELRTEGRAIKTQVNLNYTVVQGNDTSATIVDDFEDNSIYVAIGTEEPLSDPTGDQVRTLYKLRNFDGIWKVVDSVRSE